MDEVREFPMAEEVVVAALQQALDGLSDGARVSTNRTPSSPARLVRVTRTGGTRSVAEDRPIVAFECWDTTDLAAGRLAQRTRALVQALAWDPAKGSSICWLAEAGGVVRFPDPATNLPRYQHTQELQILPPGGA